MEHRDKADELEREGDDLEHQSDKVGDHIEEARRDWESKEQDSSVPGAQPDPDDDEESMAGVETDPKRVSEEGGP